MKARHARRIRNGILIARAVDWGRHPKDYPYPGGRVQQFFDRHSSLPMEAYLRTRFRRWM